MSRLIFICSLLIATACDVAPDDVKMPFFLSIQQMDIEQQITVHAENSNSTDYLAIDLIDAACQYVLNVGVVFSSDRPVWIVSVKGGVDGRAEGFESRDGHLRVDVKIVRNITNSYFRVDCQLGDSRSTSDYELPERLQRQIVAISITRGGPGIRLNSVELRGKTEKNRRPFLHGGIVRGRALILELKPHGSGRFTVNLETKDRVRIPLHISVRYDQRSIALNSFQNGCWNYSIEERFNVERFPFDNTEIIMLTITTQKEENAYNLQWHSKDWNGRQGESGDFGSHQFKHRFGPEVAEYFSIDGNVDVVDLNFKIQKQDKVTKEDCDGKKSIAYR